MRKLIVTLAVVAALLFGALALAKVGPFAPHGLQVGDSCTNLGSTFNYNDGGPGFVEQTAFGLTCQGPPAAPVQSTPSPAVPPANPPNPAFPYCGGADSTPQAQC